MNDVCRWNGFSSKNTYVLEGKLENKTHYIKKLILNRIQFFFYLSNVFKSFFGILKKLITITLVMGHVHILNGF